MKRTLMVSLMMLINASAFANEAKSADAQAVNAACTQEAATAGCGTEKVGTGLLKCIHAYKKAHSDFKPSDACKAAMKQLHHDRKEKKEEQK